ncbi:ubinuclein-1-like isoform X2 [Salvia divinorum]|uniref:Ubinuclein-1-like isoform X2 n=1 Tax=Salvia divinorum TaxID=28513 RepID=A0ABD1HPY6_SALDI
MVEGAESGGPENGPGSKPEASVEVGGGRVRFRVELNPGETTIVSWKKLLKEANLSEADGPGPAAPGPPLEARGDAVAELPPPPALASHMNETADNESQANRLSNGIERIERMYAGSSDEEDLVLDNMPDDDEYDTDDSFIDDTDLDDYFQVDKSAIKHDGFFVNRGKLERIEPSIPMDEQPKKRRKDLAQGGVSEDGHNPHKAMKMGNKGKKASSSTPRISTSHPHKEAIANVNMLGQDSPAVGPSRFQNGDAVSQEMYKDRQKPGFNKYNSGKQPGNADGLDMSILQKEKGAHVERLDLNVAASKASLPEAKESLVHITEGSSVRPKITNLEKAFGELEKIVAQFRPPSTDTQDPVNQSHLAKKRMPPEIKLELAKVARIAGSCYGQIPKEVINRLMSILGHLMQIKTLKRNLRVMANAGLSAKQEKDDQIQKMKQEVAEMVKAQTVCMKSKLEQHGANSDGFQETGPNKREAFKHKDSFDDVLENKICELCDLYVERLEEDSGLPVKRLYEELALLWPGGFMNTNRIKRAIYRAKDRKGLCSFRKDREKTKKKNVLAQDAYNNRHGTISHEKLLTCDRGSKLASSPALSAVTSGLNPGNPKQEKLKKFISSSNLDHTDTKPSSLLPKNIAKRMPNAEVAEANRHLERLVILQKGERAQT